MDGPAIIEMMLEMRRTLRDQAYERACGALQAWVVAVNSLDEDPEDDYPHGSAARLLVEVFVNDGASINQTQDSGEPPPAALPT